MDIYPLNTAARSAITNEAVDMLQPYRIQALPVSNDTGCPNDTLCLIELFRSGEA